MFQHPRAAGHQAEAGTSSGVCHEPAPRSRPPGRSPRVRLRHAPGHMICAGADLAEMMRDHVSATPVRPTSRWPRNRDTRRQRSSSRAARNRSDGSASPSRGGSGAPKSNRSPCGNVMRPVAIKPSRLSPEGEGTSNATGRPWSVTSKDSPCWTRRSQTLAFWRNSRTPICFIMLHGSTIVEWLWIM